MDTEIYWFSGTGNSLFAARELARRLPGARLLPIVAQLGREAIRTEGRAVGLVFPVHALNIPLPVRRFLRRVDLRSAGYVFAVATRLGTAFHGFTAIDRLLARQGRRLDARFLLTMASNDVKVEGYRTPTDGEIAAFESAALEKLDRVASAVRGREVHREADTEYTVDFPYGRLVNGLLARGVAAMHAFSERIGGVNYFYADSDCTGCGICAKVCLSGKIAVTDGRPAWRKDVLCTMCYACINYCPSRSVQIEGIRGVVRSFSEHTGRYTHPYATAAEIAAQKRLPPGLTGE